MFGRHWLLAVSVFEKREKISFLLQRKSNILGNQSCFERRNIILTNRA